MMAPMNTSRKDSPGTTDRINLRLLPEMFDASRARRRSLRPASRAGARLVRDLADAAPVQPIQAASTSQGGRLAAVVRAARAKIQGPSGKGWTASAGCAETVTPFNG